MAQIVKNKDYQHYEMIPHHLIKNASFQAVGLWAYLASLPEGWEFSIRGFATIRPEGEDKIRNAVHELEELGYLERGRSRNENGKMGAGVWILNWRPKNQQEQAEIEEQPKTEKRTTEKPTGDLPAWEKPTQVFQPQYNTIITKDNITKDNIKESLSPRAENGTRKRVQNQEAEELAEFLKEQILRNYPNRKIDKNYKQNWSTDIDRAIRLDGRTPEQLKNAIIFSSNDNFWKQQILSGANLRKHYDRLEARAQADFMKNGTIVI